jgi:predicted DCC family thiol-disulfide oxidoreductase YuxK
MKNTCNYCESENLSEVYFDMNCNYCKKRLFKIATETSDRSGESNNRPLKRLIDSLFPKTSQGRTYRR